MQAAPVTQSNQNNMMRATVRLMTDNSPAGTSRSRNVTYS